MTKSFAKQTLSEFVWNDNTLFQNGIISPVLAISVILPVRNEEDHIIHALDALRLQKDGSGNSFPVDYFEVLLLANNCTDQSVSIARAYQQKYPDFPLHIEDITLAKPIAHIGTVRRLLMDAAYSRFDQIGKPEGVIASTDSDSEVGPFWLYQTLAEIEKGNDVVGGRILTRPEKSVSRLYYLRDIAYKHLVSKLEDLLDPVTNDRWPRHFQCFGASFAVTCRIYDQSGRLPMVPFLEDMAFHKSLIRVDARIRLSPLVQVFTSSRIQGRVDFGLSIQLKQWGEMNAAKHAMMVEPVGSLIAKFNARKLLRSVWGKDVTSPEIEPIVSQVAHLLHLDTNWLTKEIDSYPYFGTLWEKIEEKIQEHGWLTSWPLADVTSVIPELRSEIGRMAGKQ